MKKSPSPLTSSRSNAGKENKVKETDQFSYRGPVQWKVKTYSPYRGTNVKAAQTIVQPSAAPVTNLTPETISEQLLTKIFGKRLTGNDEPTRFQKRQIPG